MWLQKTIRLKAKPRGFHLITAEIERLLPELNQINVGLVHLLLKHTSAGLTLNENADPTVRVDLNNYIDRLVPENQSYFEHTLEGPDDMPAHIKSSLLGHQLTLPVSNGVFNLGMWQGVYLGEYRNHGGVREIEVTIQGE
jgi:secondary thiamine-phosphate synthase enzyme